MTVTYSPAPATGQQVRLARVGIGAVAIGQSYGAAAVPFGYQLTDAATAQFQAAYVDAGGRVSAYSAPFTLTRWTGAVRETPNVTVTTLSDTSVRLQWASVPNAPRYQVLDYFRNTSGVVQSRWTSTTATSLDIVGLDPGVLKETRVTVTSDTDTPMSFQASAWLLPMPAPLPASQVTATGAPAWIRAIMPIM